MTDSLKWLDIAENLIEEENFDAAKEMLQSNLDSEENHPPIAICEALRLLGYIFNQQNDFDTAQQMLQEGIQIAESYDLPAQSLALCLEEIAKTYWEREEYSKAKVILQKELLLFQDEFIDNETHLNCFYLLGEVQSQLGDDRQAKEYLSKAIDVARTEEVEPEWMSDCLRSLGDVLQNLKQFDESEEALLEAVKFAFQTPVPAGKLCDSLCLLATLYHNQGEYGKADRHLQRAVILAQENDVSPVTRCYSFQMWGAALSSEGRDEEAAPFLFEALALANSLPLPAQTRCTCSWSAGEVLHNLERYEEAEELLSIAVEIARDEDVGQQTLCDCLCSFAEISYSQWDQSREKEKLNCAEKLLIEAVSIAQQEEGIGQSLCNALCTLGEVMRCQDRPIEAEEKLRQALQVAEENNLPALHHCNCLRSLALHQMDQQEYGAAIQTLEKASQQLSRFLASHNGTSGIPNVLATYQNIFVNGFQLCEQLFKEHTFSETELPDSKILWKLLAFWDAEKCISIRERLRQQISQPPRQKQIQHQLSWRSGPAEWQQLFKQTKGKTPDYQLSRLRMLHSQSNANYQLTNMLLELPDQSDDARKAQFCQPIDQSELSHLLATDQSVIIGFYFEENDLVVLPIRRDFRTKEPTIIHTETGLFRLHNVRDQLEELLKLQQQMIPLIEKYRLAGKQPDDINKELGSWQQSIFAPLYSILQWDRLFELITYPNENSGQLHLTFIPDGLLYQLPLHAAYDEQSGNCFQAGGCLFEKVASINYGLSLRTLQLQTQIDLQDNETDREIRGTVFAYSNPDGEQGHQFLASVYREVASMVEEVGIDHLWIHGDREPEPANRNNMRERHSLGNLMWNIGHGGSGEKEDRFDIPGRGEQIVFRPSILLADGVVSDSRMVAEQYDFSTLQLNHYSCCTLGRMTSLKSTQELEGWIASLTLLGCRRISSALWELCDAAAANFGRCWIKVLKEQAFIESPQPHAFAVAFKQALTEFRSLEDGRWNHEFYWTPYVLYGLP